MWSYFYCIFLHNIENTIYRLNGRMLARVLHLQKVCSSNTKPAKPDTVLKECHCFNFYASSTLLLIDDMSLRWAVLTRYKLQHNTTAHDYH